MMANRLSAFVSPVVAWATVASTHRPVQASTVTDVAAVPVAVPKAAPTASALHASAITRSCDDRPDDRIAVAVTVA
jgi:hypothetical protein